MDSAPIRVMIVDDSSITRGLFSNILESAGDIKVAGTAVNGAMAVNFLRKSVSEKQEIDVIMLDLQMPEMDGLTAIPKLLEADHNVKIIIVAALTEERAKDAMRALSLGASDYLIKPSTRDNREVFYHELLGKVRSLGKKAASKRGVVAEKSVLKETQVEAPAHKPVKYTLQKRNFIKKPSVIAVGSSTGGPQALVKLFSAFKGKHLRVPIFVTQHMPPKFTTLLAKQISENSGHKCEEAFDGEVVSAGRIYVAPGDYHMVLEKRGTETVITLNQNPPENFCRPAVDPMLRSIADIYEDRALVLILTGMGSDGLLGSRKIVEKGGAVLAQDEETSVVWGMPGAVAMDGLCVNVLPLPKISSELIDLSQGQIQ